MVVMHIAHMVDGVEPMEVDPPKDQEIMGVDPPPAWLTLVLQHHARAPLHDTINTASQNTWPAPYHQLSLRNRSSEEVRETVDPIEKQNTAVLPGRCAGLQH